MRIKLIINEHEIMLLNVENIISIGHSQMKLLVKYIPEFPYVGDIDEPIIHEQLCESMIAIGEEDRA